MKTCSLDNEIINDIHLDVLNIFFNKLLKLIKNVANLNCCITNNDVIYQSNNTIYYTNDDTGKMFLIHEFCHYIAANKTNRKCYNLSFPLFNDNLDTIYTNHIISELKTIYFTHLIFYKYLLLLLNKCNLNEDKQNISYMLYLCDINKPFIFDNLKILNINYEIWDKQLNRKLKYFNTSLNDLHIFLNN